MLPLSQRVFNFKMAKAVEKEVSDLALSQSRRHVTSLSLPLRSEEGGLDLLPCHLHRAW